MEKTKVSVQYIFDVSFNYFTLSAETKRKHKIYYNKYIKPFVEDKAFLDIKPLDIQKSLNAMQETASQDEINRVLSIWKRLYKTAIMEELTYFDNTLKVVAPKSLKIKKPKQVSTTKDDLIEISSLLFKRLKMDDALLIYVALWIMYYTGMRPAEVYALQWKNIDRENKTITICQQIGSNNDVKNVVVKTKTENSNRTIPYHPDLDDFLDMLESEDYLFLRSNGKFLNGAYVSNTLYRITGGKFRAYMLRHQFSSDLLNNHVDLRTIQELMGHSSSSMTLSYARSDDKHKKDAIINR